MSHATSRIAAAWVLAESPGPLHQVTQGKRNRNFHPAISHPAGYLTAGNSHLTSALSRHPGYACLYGGLRPLYGVRCTFTSRLIPRKQAVASPAIPSVNLQAEWSLWPCCQVERGPLIRRTFGVLGTDGHDQLAEGLIITTPGPDNFLLDGPN